MIIKAVRRLPQSPCKRWRCCEAMAGEVIRQGPQERWQEGEVRERRNPRVLTLHPTGRIVNESGSRVIGEEEGK